MDDVTDFVRITASLGTLMILF